MELKRNAAENNLPVTLNHIAVTAVDRTGNESMVKEIEVGK
jgi:hypothetical protein